MTSPGMNSRQRSVPRGTTVWGIFSHSPAPGPSGRPRNLGESPFYPSILPGMRRVTLDVRTSIMLCRSIVSWFSEKSTFFRLFRPFVNKNTDGYAIRILKFPYSATSRRSQDWMTPFSSSKVVVFTIWVLPTRICWVPSSLVRLSFTVASMVKTRS